MMKTIALLGSTGSIGQNVLKVARHLKGQVQVVALAAKENIDLLERQILEFRPSLVAVFSEKKAYELQKRLPSQTIVSGMEGLKAVAAYSEASMVFSAMVGTVGIEPTIQAILAGKTLALANKEVLVSAGSLVMALAQEKRCPIIPIDSEHSALFQCLQGEKTQPIRRLILTASGGPFRNFTAELLENISVEQALQHPTWNMGAKVSIDSSTLMNKGLEMIEAHWLFQVPPEKIEVIIHPQSVIHSMVEFCDGSILAQMSEPSMILPIQYAMTYPQRQIGLLEPFDFKTHQKLEFFEPRYDLFPCLRLAYEAISQGGSLPCYMNAASEVLVARFLAKEISWKQISIQLERLMSRHKVQPLHTIEDVLAIDLQAKAEASEAFLSEG